MTYDAARQRVVLFGGDSGSSLLSDTWEWDGTNWTRRTPAVSPYARDGHAMAYDAARQRVVLFGSTGPLTDVWEWDGGSWVRHLPGAGPVARRRHAMVYDTARQRVVLFGGNHDLAGPADDFIWEWDGSGWTQRSAATSPITRYDHAMAYDVTRQRVVLTGGQLYSRLYADTWLLGDLTRAAAQRFGAACPGSNGPPLLTSGEPYLGNQSFRLGVLSGRPGSPCLVALAAVPDHRAVGGGCTLYLRAPIVPWALVTNATGFAESPPLAIPLDTTLRGVALYAQAFVADPQGPALGLAFSQGTQLLLGD
jgi:hypothetical protein